MLFAKSVKFWWVFIIIVPLKAVVAFICLAMAFLVYLTPPKGTPWCKIHHGVAL